MSEVGFGAKEEQTFQIKSEQFIVRLPEIPITHHLQDMANVKVQSYKVKRFNHCQKKVVFFFHKKYL
jgi:hypothetical protein